MFGPQPKGFWTLSGEPGLLQSGVRYRVVKSFQDHDGHHHPVDETWIFLGQSFVPYEEGMSFFVSLDGEQEWQIRLQWCPEEQGEILDNLSSYVAAVI